ncbi:MAG: hypothetical protein QG623_198, partial [Patescibacteria group bacterium]|nr:hypothetical protein [Patescibacteria group bacterium]
ADGLPASSSALIVGDTSEKVTGTKLVVINKSKVNSKNNLLSALSAAEYSPTSATYSKLYPNADFVILVGKN